MSTPSSEGYGTSGYGGSGPTGTSTDSAASSAYSGDYYGTSSSYGSPSGPGEATLSRGAITSRTQPTRPVGAQPTTASTPAARPAAAQTSASRTKEATRKSKGPRRVRLAVARVDPWSVMKMSFLLSVAIGIAGVILTAVLWMILSTMNVFADVEGVLQSLQTAGGADNFSILDYVGFGRVVSLSIVIGVIDVILMTAIATVLAFLYNICSALVGGIQLTLTDD
ncbi:MAG TPA: DUF3566 domain-containing protein [Intrasporangium sp.]|uniref:DUF3566 domain-containing protein n=1 Tax=Intrasporangium sp. TaxID=1925024 RepID=UPI002B48202D|nr:DUF3566 domain-containing protein [Intrasporangium sp.]HKX68141.1 DUF3566 domain-containing protein [Intrasporangium sp.]